MTTMAEDRKRSAVAGFIGFIGLMFVFFAFLTSCSWQKAARITLTGHEAGLATADKVGLDHYRRECRSIAEKCPAGSDEKTCKPLGECWNRRRLLQTVLDRTALALAVTWTSLVTADQKGFKAKLAELEAAMRDLGKELATIIPGGVL